MIQPEPKGFTQGYPLVSVEVLSTNEDGVRGITATIDRKVKVFVSEASIRRHLKLEDSEGLKTLPTAEIFEQLALIGFIQIFLNKRKRMLLPLMRTFPTPTLTQKLFSNMKRASKGYSGEAAPMPYELPLQSVYSLRRDEGCLLLNELTDLCTSLSKKVESLESELKQTKQTYNDALTKLIKRGRSLIKELDLDARISLVPPHAADQRRFDETHISDQPEEQLGVFSAATALADVARRRQSVENVQTYTRIRREVSTGSGGVSTASRLVSTASELDSTAGVKAKDKGKAIMHESEPPKKIKKRVQVQNSVDEELAKKQLDEREEVTAKVDQAHDIGWSDPAILRYHTLQNRPFSMAEVRKNMCLYLKTQGGYKMSHFKGMIYEDIRPIFERVWDQNQAFIPMGFEIEKEVMKILGFDLQQESSKPVKEEIKLEDDTEKEELQVYLNIVPEDESRDVESLATKYPIVNWETHILANDKYYYQIKRVDGSGDLKTLIEPNEEDKIWRNQQDWNLINWKLLNFCGVHVLLMDIGFVIHMMVEKKYPLSQDILSKMLSRKLEVNHQSDMGYELISFVKSQLQQ
ncbi:hypothetical protein Tco_0706784 [Tanacetum coccineum]|uniref:Uncharacterized protein n=1 Tax=Tanacetum coccineum TaxID=301880 RepID=A0ABQ4Y9Y8_9ASTR